MMESIPQKIRVVDIAQSAKKIIKPLPDSVSASNSLKIRESISWSICFAIVAGITGALLVYKIGVTMSNITSILFYFSLLGFIAFVARAIRLSRSREEVIGRVESHLN